MSTTSADAAGRGTRHAGAFKTIATIAATAVAGLAITSSGVYALLKAQAFNGTAESVNSGTLLITLTDSANSGGFTQSIGNLAPGDVMTRFVQVANTGTLDGANLTLKLVDEAAIPTLLTTDTAKGLQVNVQSCTVPWTWTANTAATCSGATGLAVAQPAATYQATPQAMSATFAKQTTQYFKVAVSLPSTNVETSVNGVLPAGSIQGLTASLRWTFSLDQRAAITLSNT